MIDFDVAYDKLAQFETANEIAELFEDYGVKALKGFPDRCAVTVWMRQQTQLNIRTNHHSVRALKENGYYIVDSYRTHTRALEEFVSKFDEGCYPSLEMDPS